METGSVMNPTVNVIQATGFNSSFQVARASLLLAHPTSTTTYVYVAFGTDAGEVVAAAPTGCPTGFTSCNYSGWMFLYSVTYNPCSPTCSVTFSQTASFATSGTGRPTTTAYPSVYAQFNTSGPPEGPSGVGQPAGGGAFDRGDNWAVRQGGIWQSSGGPSSGSTSDNNVYAASGNGPFACNNANSPNCPNAGQVYYWGSSAMKFPSANSSSPLTPIDFYAPNQETFTLNSNGDPSPSQYETGELSRLDLDFGSTPPVIVPIESGQAPMFALLADKSGYMYVVPAEPNGTGATVNMGEFQKGDVGLTNGTVFTQLPFQASQLPKLSDPTSGVCPVATDAPYWTNNNASCDEIHEIALLALSAYPAVQFAFVWPMNESVEVFRGNAGTSGTGYSYYMGSAFNPCPLGYATLPEDCQGSNPQFPGANSTVQGAAMAIASGTNDATLWAITPDPSVVPGTWGWLYAYTINPEYGTLYHLWDSGTGMGNCSNTSANGWLATAFTEPTLANGAAYVPSVCVVKGTTETYGNCGQVPAANIASGILVFSACE
jgi:hypothetical protein